MDNNIRLHRCANHEFQNINKFYYMDKDINDTFGGERKDRLINACAAFIIYMGKIEIGFILLIDEENHYNIDMGIIKRFRGKGCGTIALSLLKEMLREYELNYLIQTQISNLAMNKSLENNGFTVVESNDKYNFYTLVRK